MHRFIIILAVTAACSGSRGTLSGVRPAATVLEVRNGHWEDLRIFLVRGQVPSKIGIVPAMRSQTFRLTGAEIGSGQALQLAAEAFGSRERLTSESVDVVPGNRIFWTVEGQMKQSSITIR